MADEFWSHANADRIDFLRLRVAPLLRFVPDVDVAAETFTNKVERLALAMLTGSPSPEQLFSIAEDVSSPAARDQRSCVESTVCSTRTLSRLPQATRTELTAIIRELAPEMKKQAPCRQSVHCDRLARFHRERAARHRGCPTGRLSTSRNTAGGSTTAYCGSRPIILRSKRFGTATGHRVRSSSTSSASSTMSWKHQTSAFPIRPLGRSTAQVG